MKRIIILFLCAVAWTAEASERFVETIGTVEREIPADKLAMTLKVFATEKTIEASVASVDRLLSEFNAQIVALKYPAGSVAVTERKTEKAWEWSEQKRIPNGFASFAIVSVKLPNLTNYGNLVTYIGIRDGFENCWQRMSSSVEGDARRAAIAAALQAARAKAALLAEEGGARLGELHEVTEQEVGTTEYGPSPSRNARDPNEGTSAYPIGILVRVKAKFELINK